MANHAAFSLRASHLIYAAELIVNCSNVYDFIIFQLESWEIYWTAKRFKSYKSARFVRLFSSRKQQFTVTNKFISN